MTIEFLFVDVPPPNRATIYHRDEIAKALAAHAGKWTIVARPDRQARADTIVDRINSGREYGPDHAATIRRHGGEFHVYASKLIG